MSNPDYAPENCTHNCGTCGSGCGSEQNGPSFFDKMESISETLDEVGEENILRILNETIEEWQAEDAE
ncbi:MAG: hypothetical protein ACOX8G_03505 [Eubacterium sp.]|jgi:hypothetical protein|uniref:hypothetical protein n=1 Tax=Clostridium sp. (strain SY8519) TaxID=1042156 RepID=UPI0002171A5B|nr:hypothetical protein [Clostridium sp. SY8519]BAK47500.1 archaeal shikimate kinase [Clostridium sp. SY8519]HAD19698.1 hypothetical protein [Lachnospiraceae bacterium]